MQKRYPNRPIVEFEIAAKEEMKVTELRLEKLFSTKENVPSTGSKNLTVSAKKVEGTFNFISSCAISKLNIKSG